MPRYIDADLAESLLLDGYSIDEVPSADVEPVRRCKDCSYFCTDGGASRNITYCKAFGALMEKNDFCSCFDAKIDEET